ncbi:MopE-related protein [Archangium sp.]|uniref:MopE-related protein n=1 Tax=Archangium sp. TaxID=1872627 RepID=UPI002D417920|nr:MopE-related protein [Archangium sp.]HYO55555.1 MopE-related protein [Archangium sp.]
MPLRLLLLVGLLALIGTGCRNNDGAVKLTVTYSGFKPGCIRVGVKDAQGAGEPRTTELAGKGEATGGTVTVAAFREAGWGTTLTVTAEAFEKRCEGTPVVTASETVTVNKGEVAEKELKLTATDADQDGYVSQATGGTDCDDGSTERHPGQQELCNNKDDNCDGTPDDGLALGTDCTGEGGCGGKRVCGSDASVVCNSPKPTVLYADSDQDTHGAAGAGVMNCGPTRPGYVTSSDDCDDTRANVYSGAREICDEQDNDCDGPRDEDLGVGTSCDPGLGCTGEKACAADGGTRCAYVTPPSNYYPDDDLDLHGKADAGILTCAPDVGYILQAGDCNDGNPFTHAGAPELCDQEDNNCNGSTDEGSVCPSGGGSWVAQSTGTETWQSVSVWGDGGVWIAGIGSRLRLRTPGQTTFQNLDLQCMGDWYGAWANPVTGSLTLGGTNRAIGARSVDATSCYGGTDATDTDVRGVAGVSLPDGGVEFHAVGQSRSSSTEGKLLWWDGTPITFDPSPVAPLWDVHGVSRDVLFAVGGYDTSSGPSIGARIYRFKANNWESELVQNIPGVVDDKLRGIWVVKNQTLAYAVGESSSVLMWNGTWSKHPAPPGEDLLSVVAFGKNSIYATTASGKVYRYNGSTWSAMLSLSTSSPLHDIAGTSPEDLWVAGSNGKILHWPR